MICLTPPEVRKKALERITMEDGIKIWKDRKETNRRTEIQEKKEVRELLENYWPWGRPGGGAPNSQHVGLRNVYLEEMYPNEELQKAKRRVGTFQFGRSNGRMSQNRNVNRQIGFREDPALRFQWGTDLRNTVDNKLRYRTKREEQLKYKEQLDALVAEKKKVREEEAKKQLELEREMFLRTPPWGKPGPGGKIWRHPKNIGVNFLSSMGWTTDSIQQPQPSQPQNHKRTLIKREHKNCRHSHNFAAHTFESSRKIKHPSNANQNNDIELVPLIVKRRPSMVKPQLATTDVTRGDAFPRRVISVEPKYLEDLTQQVQHKYQQMKDDREKDIKVSQQHFETWGSLWGRPGHGAPRSATQKGRLMAMLYPQRQAMPVH